MKKLLVGLVAAVVLAGAGYGISNAVSSSGVKATTCTDPAAKIAKLPVGGTWNGHDKTYCTTGVLISTAGVTVENATFNDSVTTKPIKPIVQVKETSGVTLRDLSLNGGNTTSGFHAGLVNGAGIDVKTVNGLTIDDVNTNDTFGDGLTLGWASGKSGDSNVQVSGLTITKAGRDGISPSFVKNSSFLNVNVISSVKEGLDFESDVKGVGDSNLTFDDFSSGDININEPVSYLSFANAQVRNHIYITTDGWVSFQGTVECDRNPDAAACVYVQSGWLTIQSPTTFTLKAGKTTAKPFTGHGPHAILQGV